MMVREGNSLVMYNKGGKSELCVVVLQTCMKRFSYLNLELATAKVFILLVVSLKCVLTS